MKYLLLVAVVIVIIVIILLTRKTTPKEILVTGEVTPMIMNAPPAYFYPV